MHAEWVEPPPQSAADTGRSKYKVAWHEVVKVESDGHKTTGTYEAAIPPLGRKLIGSGWVFTCKTDSWLDSKDKS